ncbi:ribonuclease Y [Phycisphaera mikurensis]|uniref:Ribonuclease Y n=1 Tax=Phycisphaera mikurensis (strain NBRC 102666 / KCTC 22515 / FYK2301M01) TaxID=1142394 RepID=I0ID73_PHYMF|nr:ribonuclease Y [Phycisphaera mikurensis]MBB6442338.1 ribonuclease Y [Phycisphaera mikurensis]BAM03211.1 2',3'-cyclic-nucleotide 2'-phosphodiesterase [Phycisphaera mikurensis NBRC 102666]
MNTDPLTPSLAVLSEPQNLWLVLFALAGGLILGYVVSRQSGARSLAATRREIETKLAAAEQEGRIRAKQIELDARNAVAERREGLEKELQGDRDKLVESQRRLTKREDLLDTKLATLAARERAMGEQDERHERLKAALAKREDRINGCERELAAERAAFDKEHRETLLRAARMSEEEAKREALTALTNACQEEAAAIVKASQERAAADAKQEAMRITLEAIQRYASEHSAESTSNTVKIEDDAMKGRVIGREGRNIRAFEAAMGVDVVVDDTPGIITVSCFDPVRRATATEALTILLKDGRIHPARIEEVVEKVSEDFTERIQKFGRDAANEVHLPGLHPRVIEAMGRMHYRTSYGQNILRHSVEVAFLCQVIADELGLDGALARRCGFLHDLGKAMDHDVEGGHPRIGADFLRKHGERSEAVLNAVEGHHNDVIATTPYTPVVMAADAISGARPGARRETMEKYVKRLRELEGIARRTRGVREAYAIQAGREVRVIVDPHGIDDAGCHVMARSIAQRVSDEMSFPGEIKITVMREMRTVDFAR